MQNKNSYVYLNVKTGDIEYHNETQCKQPHLMILAIVKREKKYAHLKKVTA